MIVDLKWKLPKPEPKQTTALDIVLGASVILFFSFVTVCAVLGVAL